MVRDLLGLFVSFEFHFPVKSTWPDDTNGVARWPPGGHDPSFKTLGQMLASFEHGSLDLASLGQRNSPNFENRKRRSHGY